MAAKTTLTVRVRIEGIHGTLAAFRGLPKSAANHLRDASLAISAIVARKTAAAGVAEGGAAALLAPTVKAVRDRVPAVQVGGTRKLGRNRAPAWHLLFVSEFGMNERSGWFARDKYALSLGIQHRPHNGGEGYWFFPSVYGQQAMMAERWRAAADEILDGFGAVPDGR